MNTRLLSYTGLCVTLATMTAMARTAAASCTPDKVTELWSLLTELGQNLMPGKATCSFAAWLGMASQLCGEDRNNYSPAAAALMKPFHNIMALAFKSATKDFPGDPWLLSEVIYRFSEMCGKDARAIGEVAAGVLGTLNVTGCRLLP